MQEMWDTQFHQMSGVKLKKRKQRQAPQYFPLFSANEKYWTQMKWLYHLKKYSKSNICMMITALNNHELEYLELKERYLAEALLQKFSKSDNFHPHI